MPSSSQFMLAILLCEVSHTTVGRRSLVYDVKMLQHTCPTKWRWQLPQTEWRRHCHPVYYRSWVAILRSPALRLVCVGELSDSVMIGGRFVSINHSLWCLSLIITANNTLQRHFAEYRRDLLRR